ncbi:unnamed protein product [Cyclocybe aegerita]|uniref:N-acetyltransferase domain-containing protein n=1 Tax=Cyclocybe aegerita TaxID=1973307 RepID=A0A8S0WCP5_CYCAE|nr:unnamed protein product [Cyclocybe aegerita]
MLSVSPLDNIVVKALTSRDVHQVRDLHSKLLPVKYPPSFFLQLLLLPNRACFIAYNRGHPSMPIGFISAAAQRPSSTTDCFTFCSPKEPSLVSAHPHDDASLTLGPVVRLRLEILTLGVLPAYQHCGLARHLVQCVLDNFRESCTGLSADGTLLYANVSTSNTTALKFYERMGMTVSSDVIRNLYRTVSYGCKDAYLVMGIV